jgi:NAD(P)-dependent dehydrogenase (short-subunit alcohol dehydrogenase family)
LKNFFGSYRPFGAIKFAARLEPDHVGFPFFIDSPMPVNNHVSKGAVRIYSKAAAVRYGPSGVRVNTVHPRYMPPMLNATNAGERADKIAMTPLRRIGKPIEVAYGVLFLASDEASFITGTELVIDGGFIAQ